MKIAIIGASSFIGRRLYMVLKENSNFFVTGTYFKNNINNFIRLDITSKKDLLKFLFDNMYDYVIWLSAIKDVKLCQNNYELAYNINTKPIMDFIDIKNKYKFSTKIIFLSSDYVFDGDKGHYIDNDFPKPKTNYGITKNLAEKYLIANCVNDDYMIIRTSAVIGKGGVFWEWLLKSLENDVKVELFSNIYFTPTPLNLLVDCIVYILNNKVDNKVVHICGGNRFSRYDFGNYIKKINPIEFKAKIVKITACDNELFPYDLSLVNSKLCGNFIKKDFINYIREEI